MCEGRSHKRQLCPVPDVRDESLQGLPQAVRPLFLRVVAQRFQCSRLHWQPLSNHCTTSAVELPRHMAEVHL